MGGYFFRQFAQKKDKHDKTQPPAGAPQSPWGLVDPPSPPWGPNLKRILGLSLGLLRQLRGRVISDPMNSRPPVPQSTERFKHDRGGGASVPHVGRPLSPSSGPPVPGTPGAGGPSLTAQNAGGRSFARGGPAGNVGRRKCRRRCNPRTNVLQRNAAEQ